MHSHRQRQRERQAGAAIEAAVRFDRPGPDGRVVDPVCFMRVLTRTPHRIERNGTTYRFCSERCREKFRQDPHRYLSSAVSRKLAAGRRGAPAPADEPIFAVRSDVAGGARDPVCHMTVSPDSPHRLEHQGRAYRFCTARCREKFRAWPGRYVRPAQPEG